MAVPTAGNPQPNEDEEKLNVLRKVLKLDHYQLEIESIRQNVDLIKAQMVENTNLQNQVIDRLNSIINPGQGTTPAGPLNMADPVQKMQLVTELSKALAEVVRAWKGSAADQSQDALSGIGKQMITDLVRATVDDVQQRVYNIRKIPPPDVLHQARSVTHEPA